MGKTAEPGTCVDADFKIVGMEGLRVVDMSVAPFLPRCGSFLLFPVTACVLYSLIYGFSAHTQAPAYLIGETAAEKIIAAYS